MAKTGALAVREDQVVEDGAVDRLRDRGQATRRPAIRGAGPGIAARMIVGDDNSGAAVHRRIPNDLADRESSAGFIPPVTREMEAARLVVDMRDPDAFMDGARIGEAAGEELSRRRKPVELQRKFGTLISHAW